MAERTALALRFAAFGIAALLATPVDAAAPAKSTAHAATPIVVANPSIATLARAMAEGRATSASLTRGYLDRIARLDRRGPTLNAVIAVMPDAMAQARARDAERRAGRVRGPLHGIPILVKDNIETREAGVPTTAGSLALKGNVTRRDAPLVARLRDAGAVILGKTNLSEWANIRSGASTSGWSAVGGLVRNPHALDRNACGSSSGSGAAMAAGFAAATVGTETDGSIVCPSSVNGIVGFKPSLGLVSRRHIVPISSSQDTAGPMTATVHDAALLLDAMAGVDEHDAVTREAVGQRAPSHAAQLASASLAGKRIGVMRDRLGDRPAVIAAFDRAVAAMRRAGADVVDIADTKQGLDGLDEAEFDVLLTELKATLDAYLRTSPAPLAVRSLADVIAFNQAHRDDEMRWFGQEFFEQAQAKPGLDDPGYRAARDKARRLAGAEGLDKLLREHRVDALVAITAGPAWTTDLVNGDHFVGPSASQLPAVAGYPHLTLPMGRVHGLPVGLSFIGARWRDADVLALGHAYERVRDGGVADARSREVARRR